MMRYKGKKDDELQNKEKNMNAMNHEFSSDTSNFLANIFKSKSIAYIKLIILIFFLIFIFIIVMEFIFTILNVQKIKINIFQMRNAYKLLEDLCYIKYCVTELVLIDKYGDNYAILIGYKMEKLEDVIWLQEELEKYSFDFSNIYGNFTDVHTSKYSERYQNFLNTQILIYTLTNGKHTNQTISFTAMMDRIPSTLFFVSEIKDTNRLNLTERNLYDLMFNLLNGYFIYIKEFSLILADDAVESSKNSIICSITFYSSFIFSIIFLIFIWKLLSKFLIERQKPINLFLTIKKRIFEDLKNASESFSNKLLNKQMGNEDNEEENQKDYQTNIKESDINIVKFKASNEYKTKSKSKNNKEQLRDYIKLVIFFVLIQVYIIFKFFYSKNNISSVKKFLDIFNITYYSFVDIIINIDISKQFIYNRTMPIYYHKNNERGIDKESAFYTTFYNITNSFEEMIIKTSNTNAFLKNKYLDTFSLFLYHNFSKEVFIDTEYMPNLNLLGLLDTGFILVVNNIFEKLRFVWVECYENKPNTINDLRWCDIDYLVLYIVKPWYKKIIEIMHKDADDFLNGARVVQISLFIVVIVIFILSYFIFWKSYEESLTILLYRSFDLIKLIPEEIKYIIVSKLNE